MYCTNACQNGAAAKSIENKRLGTMLAEHGQLRTIIVRSGQKYVHHRWCEPGIRSGASTRNAAWVSGVRHRSCRTARAAEVRCQRSLMLRGLRWRAPPDAAGDQSLGCSSKRTPDVDTFRHPAGIGSPESVAVVGACAGLHQDIVAGATADVGRSSRTRKRPVHRYRSRSNSFIQLMPTTD